jgi:hypothetical protein
MTGSDWLLGDVGKKARATKKLVSSDGIAISREDIDAVLADVVGSGKKLRASIDAATGQLEALKNSGLTGEALVLLVAAKVSRSKNGTRIGVETVQTVLEGLFRLGEHVR